MTATRTDRSPILHKCTHMKCPHSISATFRQRDLLMITVYLDSQDYSTLTDPKQLTPALLGLREQLKDYAKSGRGQFVFSGIVVSEVTPLTLDAGSLATAKADLLSELCGRNTLVSFDRLLRMEINALSGTTDLHPDPLDREGNWFPELSPMESGGLWREMEMRLGGDLKDSGFTRQQRRAHSRKFIKSGQPRSTVRSLFDQYDAAPLMQKFLVSYPMSPEHAWVLSQYARGRATDAEFDEALRGSMRDPKWMMRWFATSQALASPIAEIVRKPGREIGALMRNLATISKDYAESLLSQDPPGSRAALAKEWGNRQDSQMCGIVSALAESKSLAVPASFDAADVVTKCPGLATMLGALYSRVWENVAGGKKKVLSDSLPVDTMHSLYAPYVDVFRADREMAHHIAKQLKLHGTTVVPTREKLPEVIERLLKSKILAGD